MTPKERSIWFTLRSKWHITEDRETDVMLAKILDLIMKKPVAPLVAQSGPAIQVVEPAQVLPPVQLVQAMPADKLPSGIDQLLVAAKSIGCIVLDGFCKFDDSTLCAL